MSTKNGHGYDDETPAEPIRPSAEKARQLAPVANLIMYFDNVFKVKLAAAMEDIIKRDGLTILPYDLAAISEPIRDFGREMIHAADELVALPQDGK